jgi:hypothetical protein
MSRKNLYPGVNPHLNSALQSTGGDWQSFHNSCIERMADFLEQVLPAGYYPFTEESLQLKRIDTQTGSLISPTRRNRPDVLINRRTVRETLSTGVSSVSTPTLTLPVLEEIPDDDPIMSVVVFSLEKAGRGEPITRIELLSPANKPGGGHYNQYMVNRNLTLQSGLRLVEIDWLHETRPLLSRIPIYLAREEGAFPYSILVSDPRPSIYEGMTEIYGFHVKDALPVLNIPLDGEDVATVDFGEVYNRTFQQRYAYHTVLTDYTKKPERFETYSEEDQAYILRRMAEIAEELK